ncbi:MFS general substrate transporter [Athelia psychrophila]|uniref:MFS general substrate transporter n=1 Tax=Athelia psychrophila TaxID=1759441 RepID=A0A166AB31_9AGAM|nr:MFS general substrate transporter [Fibularhizoctonia sp. CBS 109695]
MPTERTPLVSDQDGTSEPVQYTAVQDAKKPKKKQTPLPKVQLFAMMLIQFCEPVTGTVIYPFVVSLVNETGITGGDQAKTGYYAGIIESVFFASEALTAFAWGRASDLIGRRIPLAFGMLCLAAAIASFGLSNKYWPLVVCRCIQGIMNGNIGISKSVIIDITDSTNIAQAFSFIPLTWGLGVVVGPMIGGALSHPAEQWSSTLGKMEFLRQYPYALPCFTAALVPLAAFVFTTLFFKETLPSAVAGKKRQATKGASPDDDVVLPSSALESQGAPPLRALMTRPILIILLNYAFLAWTEQSCTVLLTLMYPTKIEYGGLSLSSFAIGVIMSFVGVMIGVFSLVTYPWLMARYSAKQVYRTCYAGYLASPILFSLMNVIARRRGAVDAPVWILIGIQVVTGAVSIQAFGAFLVLLSQATEAGSMGAINGLAQTVACSMRMFAPFITSSLFSLSQENNLLGGRMVFLFLELVVISGCVAASRIEEGPKSEDE